MTPAPTRVLTLCSSDPKGADDLVAPLAQAGWTIDLRPAAELDLSKNGTQLILVDEEGDRSASLTACQGLRGQLGDNFIPIVYLARQEAARRPALEAGADLVLPRRIDVADLLAQLQALGRVKQRHDQLRARAAEAHRVSKSLQDAYQQINHELELARRIQASFLPPSLPELPKVRFAVEYRPCGQVGGDFYDVFRLDEHHYGFYVADAMGHGVGASLLTIFVKTSVRAKEIAGQSYRLIPPDEVLHRLNHEFIDQALSDTPFITMIYGLFDFREGVLHFSRAGHPYPLYVPREGPIELWQMEGSLLGVFATQYRLRLHKLRPGDKVLFYTDAMDAAGFGEHAVGTPSLLAAVEAYRRLPVKELVQRLAMDLFTSTRQTDDLTILGMEVPE